MGENLGGGGGEAATHQLYLSTARKYEALKEEYENLHKRYGDLMSTHSATVSQLEVTQEELTCLRKRYDEVVHELKTAIRERNGLQQQCTAAIRQWDNALRERNEAKEQLSKVQQQRDEAMKEITQAMAFRIKATKDLTRLTEERNATFKEYNLVMSERDTVHKEIERLQEELTSTQQKLKSSEGLKKATFEEVESLRREVTAVLQDRDHAIKECNDLREKYGDFVTGREDNGDWGSSSGKGEPRQWGDKSSDARKDRNLSQLSGSWEPMPTKHSKNQCQRLDDLDQANREIESLRRQFDRLQAELTEAHQEAEVCKRRRDWAFSERDKIVLERESIRTLCDKLRRERDRAVSDLAEALRDSDDIKRQRNEATKELKELREKLEAHLEKESRIKQLNSVGNNYSRDSAIDADLQEFDVETLDVTLREFDIQNPGFEIAGGKGDPLFSNDNSFYVSNIQKGSVAHGRLKLSDCILKINTVDVSNMDRKNMIELFRASSSTLNLVVKRRKLIPCRGVNTVNLQLGNGRPTGLGIESGIFVSSLLPGSPAAQDGTISIGDRLLSINGKSLETLSTAQSLLDSGSSSSLLLTFIKYGSNGVNASPPSSSCSSGNNLIEKVDHDKNQNGPSENGNTKKDRQLSSSKTNGSVESQSKVLVSSGVQTEEMCLFSPVKNIPYGVVSPSSIRSKLSSSSSSQERAPLSHSPSSQPTLLDRAYHKIFGERRPLKERKLHISSPATVHHQRDDYDPIADFESVIDYHSRTMTKPPKSTKKKQALEPNSGTWPKYRGAQFQFAEVGTVASLQPHKRKERKSLASFSKHASMYEKKSDRVNCGSSDQCTLMPPRSRERIPMFVSNHQHNVSSKDRSTVSGAQVLPATPGIRSSSSGSSSYTSPDCVSPQKSVPGYHSSDQLANDPRLHYSSTASPESCLDYSVVSAHRDKDVLEYYKNRNRQRPKSAHYVLSDSECMSSLESSLSSRYCKPIGSPTYDQMAYSALESQAERIMISRNNEMQYQTSVTTSSLSPVNYLRSNLPFYPVSGGQRVTHSHIHHPHPPNSMCSSHARGVALPLMNPVRYSSPPSLSIFTSRSGDSLLSGSTAESASVDTRSYNSRLGSNGRHSMKDSGRYSFTPSPSPCPSQYSYSGPSPTQSIDMAHFHPIAAASQTPKRLVPSHPHVHAAFRVEDHYSPPPVYDGLSTFPKRSQRIRIPSNPSVASKSSGGKVSTSSIEKSFISERSSPMPAFTIEWLSADGTHPIATDYRGKKPDPGDIRNIYIEKSSEPLGIQICCSKIGGGIFVSSVTENSLAAQVGLQIGDQLLEVCGINMRSATYLLAANVLRQCGDNITMLVQYSPDTPLSLPDSCQLNEYQESVAMETSTSSDEEEEEDDDEDDDEDSPLQTPLHTPAASPKPASHSSPISKSSPSSGPPPPPAPLRKEDVEQLSTEDISSSATSTLTKQKVANHGLEMSKAHKNSNSRNAEEPRLVILKKTSSNLGISLLGGNAVGIFIHSIQEDSPASGQNGLRPGDQILEYNDIDLRQATAEEAAYELAKPTDKITVLAQYNVEKYNEIQDQPGDSFYIKTLFDRPSIDGSLTFHKDDVLFVDNTMFNGVPGLWRAWLVDQEGQKVKCGYIPSKYKMEEELLMKRSLGELEVDGARRGATSARRSFFRRKKHQRNNSRDSKELASFSDVSINSCSDSGTLGEELLPLTYQRVERLDTNRGMSCGSFEDLMVRPVILVGPLMEVVIDKLEQEFPLMFRRCIPEVMRGSQQMMERGLQELKFVDYRRRGSHFECTTVASVKEICSKNCHALLDVCPSASERLNRCQIFPIVIFLKFRTTKQIREVKDSRYLTEKLTTKAAKEMYEHALKIESEYKPIINVTIPGSNLTYMCTQVKRCVEEQQSKTLWVPCSTAF